MSRKSTLSVSGASEHVGTSHIPSNATPSAEKSAGLYDKWKKVFKTWKFLFEAYLIKNKYLTVK